MWMFLALLSLPADGVTEPLSSPENFYYHLFDGNLVIVQTFESVDEHGKPKKYTITKITTRENLKMPTEMTLDRHGRLSQESLTDFLQRLYVPSLISFIDRFHKREYRQRGGEEALSEIAKERPFLSTPSTWVMISDENNLENIHAVFRVVRRDTFKKPVDLDAVWKLARQGNIGDINIPLDDYLREHEQIPRLDLENRLDFDLPEIPLRMNPRTGDTVGAWAEIKSLIIDKNAPERFLNLLLFSLVLHGQHSILEAQSNIPYEQYQNTDGLNSLSVKKFTAADHFVVETIDRGLVRLYERLGFKVFKKVPEKNSYVMTISLEDFEKKTVSEKSEKGLPLKERISNEGVWHPLVLLPPDAYVVSKTDPRYPAVHQVGRVRLSCQNLTTELGTPFFTRDNSQSNVEWRVD